jgi:hypothetical protein
VQPGITVPEKLLYKVTESSGTQSVVKFSSAYGADIHEALAKEGLAPTLVSHAVLPGGWHMSEMDLLEKPWLTLQQILEHGSDDEIEAVVPAVEAALKQAHAVQLEGGPFAWGDARPSNIFVHRWVPILQLCMRPDTETDTHTRH